MLTGLTDRQMTVVSVVATTIGLALLVLLFRPVIMEDREIPTRAVGVPFDTEGQTSLWLVCQEIGGIPRLSHCYSDHDLDGRANQHTTFSFEIAGETGFAQADIDGDGFWDASYRLKDADARRVDEGGDEGFESVWQAPRTARSILTTAGSADGVSVSRLVETGKYCSWVPGSLYHKGAVDTWFGFENDQTQPSICCVDRNGDTRCDCTVIISKCLPAYCALDNDGDGTIDLVMEYDAQEDLWQVLPMSDRVDCPVVPASRAGHHRD